jgi:hypothetical protein
MTGKTPPPTAKVAKAPRASSPGRGSKPGERRGGRVAGTPNHCTRTLKELAREHTAEALDALVNVIRSTESDAARVSAIKEMFDRGYGKASQVIAGDADNPIVIAGASDLIRKVAEEMRALKRGSEPSA